MIGALASRRIHPSALLRRWDVGVEARQTQSFDRTLALINLKRIEITCILGIVTDLIDIRLGTINRFIVAWLPIMAIIAIVSRRTLTWTSLRAQQVAVVCFVVVAMLQRMIACFLLSGHGRVGMGYITGMFTIALLFVLRPRTATIILSALFVPFILGTFAIRMTPEQRLVAVGNNGTVLAIALVASALIYVARRNDFTQRRLIRAQNSELAAKNEELDQLMAIAAHDLRSPLYGLRNLLDLATRRAPNDPELAFRVMRDGIFSVDAMLSLVTRLLDAHSAEHAALAAAVVEDVRGPMLAAARRNAVAAKASAVAIELALPDAPLVARFDRLALDQILDNLLGNAIRFSPAGGTIDLVGRLEAGRILLSVVDQGPGVDKAVRARLFEKFSSVATPGRKAGTNMGLFIAATFAARMGATLAFRDAASGGAAFDLALPAG